MDGHGRTFVGFGFGPIMGGLFLPEAQRSRAFSQLVVSEIDDGLCRAIAQAGGEYSVNVATASGVVKETVRNVSLVSPSSEEGAERLVGALAAASEIATALPSVRVFTAGKEEAATVAGLLAKAGQRKLADDAAPKAIVYCGENSNEAANILREAVLEALPLEDAKLWTANPPIEFLDTVIGKMSKVVSGGEELARRELSPLASGLDRAFLVEEFNRILVSAPELPGMQRKLTSFQEKKELEPFEEAKLYGHNAVHMLLGLQCGKKNFAYISEARNDSELMNLARRAFLEECGPGVCSRNRGIDPLFTEEGWKAYAEDLVERMVNPWLEDTVERVTRDLRRKLGWDDRLVGTLRLALAAGVEAPLFREAIHLALHFEGQQQNVQEFLKDIWKKDADSDEQMKILAYLQLEDEQ